MQTRSPLFPSVSSTSRRVCVLACIGVLVASLTACSAPRIAGRAEAEQQPSPCEKAYADATANADIMADRSRHIVMRYLAAQEAVSDWANTAAYCPARFADGTKVLAHPDIIADSATGLFAPTDAVIEMNCARSEIAAVASSSNSTSDSAQSRTTAENSSDDSRQQSLGILTSMIADRVDLALTWGYPSFDEALFE